MAPVRGTGSPGWLAAAIQSGWTRPPVHREMLPQPQLPRPPEPGPPPGGSLGTLSNAQLRELLGDERRLQRIVRLSGQENLVVEKSNLNVNLLRGERSVLVS
ncbi:uncharacterized protein LOC144824444 [Lissotriton helveticus]